MQAADVMSERVFRVRPDTSVLDIARILVERQISALPVVDDTERLVGIVTERDLMRRPEIGTELPRRGRGGSGGDPGTFAERTVRAAAYAKSHGITAADVMTRNVIAVSKDTPLDQVVELMETRRIKRVPVVEDGRLAGIVSRLDLVRALYVQSLKAAAPSSPVTDQEIEARLTAEVASQGWRLAPSSKITVFEGVVHLYGGIASVQERHALAIAARAIPGVRAVRDHLEIREPRIEFI